MVTFHSYVARASWVRLGTLSRRRAQGLRKALKRRLQLPQGEGQLRAPQNESVDGLSD